jgi:lipoprotein-releasing system ATP-binding protein
LDASSAEALGDLFVELTADEGIAMVVVTHSEELARRFNKIYRLRDGTLEADGA